MATTTKPKTETKTQDAGPIRIRCAKKSHLFPWRDDRGKLNFARAENFILTLDPKVKWQLDLAEQIRGRREYGTDFRELGVETEGQKSNTADSLAMLINMDRNAIWGLFEMHELNHFHLDQNSTKEDLMAAYIDLNKS